MLVLSRKNNQSILIGSNIRVVVVRLEGDRVKLGIEAPRDVPVRRSEVREEIERDPLPGASSVRPVGKASVGADTSRDADGHR